MLELKILALFRFASLRLILSKMENDRSGDSLRISCMAHYTLARSGLQGTCGDFCSTNCEKILFDIVCGGV